MNYEQARDMLEQLHDETNDRHWRRPAQRPCARVAALSKPQTLRMILPRASAVDYTDEAVMKALSDAAVHLLPEEVTA